MHAADNGAATANGKASKPPTPVVTTVSEERVFERLVDVQGSLDAKNFALVSPRIKGVLDNVFVREGDSVVAGETKLFQTDSLKLERTLDITRNQKRIAQLALEEKKAALEKTQADYNKAEKDYQRSRELFERKVISASQFDTDKLAYDQQQAQIKLAKTTVDLAAEQARQSGNSVSIAEKEVRDSVVVAPINGIVSKRLAEPGENGDAGVPVIRIDDVKELEAVAFIPGQFYANIEPGATKVRISIFNKKIGEFLVEYKSPAIDSALRTFKIKAVVEGDGTHSVPGTLADMRVILYSEKGVGVPREAIQRRSDKSWVFIAEGNIAKMVEIKPGLETDGWVKVENADFPVGAKIVIQGQFLLEDGSPIRERKGGE